MDVYIQIQKCTGLRECNRGTAVRLLMPFKNDCQEAVMTNAHHYDSVSLNDSEYIKYYRVKFDTVTGVFTTVCAVLLSRDNLGMASYTMYEENTKEPVIVLRD